MWNDDFTIEQIMEEIRAQVEKETELLRTRGCRLFLDVWPSRRECRVTAELPVGKLEFWAVIDMGAVVLKINAVHFVAGCVWSEARELLTPKSVAKNIELFFAEIRQKAATAEVFDAFGVSLLAPKEA